MDNNASPKWKTVLKETAKVVTFAVALSGPANAEASPMIDMMQGCKGKIGVLLGNPSLSSELQQKLKKVLEQTTITKNQVLFCCRIKFTFLEKEFLIME